MSTLSKINLNGTQYDIKEKLSSEYTSYNIAYEPLPGDYVETAISKLHKVILDNEYVTVSALSELNNMAIRIIEVQQYINEGDSEFTTEIYYINSYSDIFHKDKRENPYKFLLYTYDDYINNVSLDILCTLTGFDYNNNESLIYTGYDINNSEIVSVKLTENGNNMPSVTVEKIPISKHNQYGLQYDQTNNKYYISVSPTDNTELNDYSIITHNDIIIYSDNIISLCISENTDIITFKTFSTDNTEDDTYIDIYKSQKKVNVNKIVKPCRILYWNNRDQSIRLHGSGGTQISVYNINCTDIIIDTWKTVYYWSNSSLNADLDQHVLYINTSADALYGSLQRFNYLKIFNDDNGYATVIESNSIDLQLQDFIVYATVDDNNTNTATTNYSVSQLYGENSIVPNGSNIYIKWNSLKIPAVFIDNNEIIYSITIASTPTDNNKSKCIISIVQTGNVATWTEYDFNSVAFTGESDPIFKSSTAYNISNTDIANWNSKTSNVGTITGITMNGVSKGTAGVIDLGTVITAHQDISGKQDVITDLETIRSNAALGATALQNYNETDPVFVRSAAYNITSTDIGNWNSKTSNVGTITGITMNGANKGTSGVVDLGTVITDISGKVDKESGKGLSTNDYTSEEKTKLANINIGDLSNLTTTELNTIFS